MIRKIALLVAGTTAAVALAGCGGSKECIVLANSGNKLCGADAAAWCSSTDSLRSSASDLGVDTSSSEAACSEIESSVGS